MVGRMSQYERRRPGSAGPSGHESTPSGVTPQGGKEALGRWRAPHRKHRPDIEPGSDDNHNRCRARGITNRSRGVCRRELKPRDNWEGPLGKAVADNRTREIRTSGMGRGLRGNVAYGRTVNPSCNRKGSNGNPLPKSARAPVLLGCSGRQGHSPAGESPAVSIARNGHVAIPQFTKGNLVFIAWSKRPGCPADTEPQW